MKKKVVMDLGHSFVKDRGATAVNGESEYSINQAVGRHFFELSKRYEDEIEFIFTNLGSQEYMGLSDRVRKANVRNADIMVSIHHNAFNGKAHGAETIHSIHGGKGKELAELIASEFNTVQEVRRVFSKESSVSDNKDYFYLIRYTSMPCVITEFAFIDSHEDFKDIDEDYERRRQAQLILNGILKFFGIKAKTDEEEQVRGVFITEDDLFELYKLKEGINEILDRYVAWEGEDYEFEEDEEDED
jgi:N-acetylmuramoyl-L-alanine amidase